MLGIQFSNQNVSGSARALALADHDRSVLTSKLHACRLVDRDNEPKAPKKSKKKKAPKKKSDKGFGR